jgi:hypothetical protein
MTRLAACALLLCAACYSAAQVPALQPHPAIARLAPISYPPSALDERVAGDVVLAVALHADGSVESIKVESGPPLLQQAVLANAEANNYECAGCGANPSVLHLTYRFQSREGDCSESASKPDSRVSQSVDTITISARAIPLCQTGFVIDTIRARGLQCLFLWRCGWRRID